MKNRESQKTKRAKTDVAFNSRKEKTKDNIKNEHKFKKGVKKNVTSTYFKKVIGLLWQHFNGLNLTLPIIIR